MQHCASGWFGIKPFIKDLPGIEGGPPPALSLMDPTARVLIALALTGSVTNSMNVKLGIESLVDGAGLTQLHGKRVVAFANPTALHPRSLDHLVDILAATPNVSVVAILAPEHGFRGDLQAEHGDPAEYRDNATGIAVYSVYRRTPEAIQAILSSVRADIVVSDFQALKLLLLILTTHSRTGCGDTAVYFCLDLIRRDCSG